MLPVDGSQLVTFVDLLKPREEARESLTCACPGRTDPDHVTVPTLPGPWQLPVTDRRAILAIEIAACHVPTAGDLVQAPRSCFLDREVHVLAAAASASLVQGDQCANHRVTAGMNDGLEAIAHVRRRTG